MTPCPVCNQRVELFDLFLHLYYDHQDFLAIWIAVQNPLATPEELTTIFNMLNYQPEPDPPDDTYEYYSELCDQLGRHVVTTLPDTVSTIVTAPSDTMAACSICLESFGRDALVVRRLNVCQHEFCAECIETWLGLSKLCPNCKTDTTIVTPTVATIVSTIVTPTVATIVTPTVSTIVTPTVTPTVAVTDPELHPPNPETL